MMLSLRNCASLLLLTAMACDPVDVEEDPAGAPDPDADELAAAADPLDAAASCCAASSSEGCSDVSVEACVCDADPYCCNTAWDSICVGEVASLGCGTCSTGEACCSATASPGCELPSVQSCVCAADPYCCTTAWDSICVGEVESLGCGSCEFIDLHVSDIEVPAVACPGEDFGPSTALQVTNGGSSNVGSFFHVGWYLSSDEELDAGDRLLVGGRDQILSLAAGASTWLDINSKIVPADATPGPQYLLTIVDEFDTFAESDEINNLVVSPIEIEAECAVASEWARSVGGTGAETLETGSAVAVDADGNTYALMTFYSASITLGGTTYTRTGLSDALLASWDVDGGLRWAKKLGGSAFDIGRGIDVDASGNVYVAGETEGTLDLGGGALPPTGAVRNIWIASYDGSGAHRWSKRHGGTGSPLLRDLAVGDGGDVLVVGHSTGSISVGGGLLTSAGSADMLVLALDTAGAHQWSRMLGGTGDDHAAAVAVDGSGEVALGGYFTGTVNFGTGALVSAGSADGVTIGLDAAGATRWARRYGSTGIDITEDVVLDEDGNAYMIGGFVGTVDLGGGALVSAGNRDIVVGSYDADGVLRWARRAGGTQLDYGRGIALDGDGDPVVAGSFFGPSADFGGGAHAGAGNYDSFHAGYAASSGAYLFSHTLGTAATEEAWDVAMSPGGTVVLAGLFSNSMTAAETLLTTVGGNDLFVASVLP